MLQHNIQIKRIALIFVGPRFGKAEVVYVSF